MVYEDSARSGAPSGAHPGVGRASSWSSEKQKRDGEVLPLKEDSFDRIQTECIDQIARMIRNQITIDKISQNQLFSSKFENFDMIVKVS